MLKLLLPWKKSWWDFKNDPVTIFSTNSPILTRQSLKNISLARFIVFAIILIKWIVITFFCEYIIIVHEKHTCKLHISHIYFILLHLKDKLTWFYPYCFKKKNSYMIHPTFISIFPYKLSNNNFCLSIFHLFIGIGLTKVIAHQKL